MRSHAGPLARIVVLAVVGCLLVAGPAPAWEAVPPDEIKRATRVSREGNRIVSGARRRATLVLHI